MIPPSSDGGIFLVDLPVARAGLVVVVDNPGSLQMGADRHRTHILEAALLQVFADSVRQTGADWDRPVVSLIQNRLASGVSPDVIGEAAMLF